MHRLSLFGFALLAAGQGAAAQRPVDGGAQLRQIPPVPAAPRSDPDIRVTPARPAAVSDTDGAKVAVTTLRLTGQTLFAEKDLIAATGFRAGQGFSLGDLRALAAKIADYYNSRGYLLAQAYLPAQSITDGIVTVAVIEGRYGAVTLTNRSRLKSGVPRHALDGLDSGDPVSSAPLQRRLLLLSDMPGIAATSTLAPGTSVGTSDLLVDVVPGRFVTGSVEADNAGNRYTGTYRVGGTINLNNPSGHGDVLSLRVLGSTDHLAYARLSYQTRLGNATVGAAYAHFGYRLGREFAQIDASGTADVVS
ncbi:MAG: POTRA domain-containing protein, partial [Sphingobium sp.]